MGERVGMTVISSVPEQTQESIQRFEQQAGLRDAGYTPHKGLTTEETKYLRVAEALHVSSFDKRPVLTHSLRCGLARRGVRAVMQRRGEAGELGEPACGRGEPALTPKALLICLGSGGISSGG